MKVIKVSKPSLDSKGYVLDKLQLRTILGEIDAMLDYGEVGDDLLLTIDEMPKEEFDNLDEFTGW